MQDPLVKLEHDTNVLLETLRDVKKVHLALAKRNKAGDFTSRVKIVRPGLYSHMRRSEAIWNFLFFAGIPQTAGQICAAITRGRVKSKAKDELGSTQSACYYGTTVGRLKKFGRNKYVIG